MWLLIAGVLVSLVTRKIIGGSGYGTMTDILLGITGACAADWLIGVFASPAEVAWSYKILFIIWGAAALPLVAHIIARSRAPRTESLSQKEPLK
jgi:uncharacterized membrane protein YeaQ/YmgE (transglycosylase-associated protein family)